MDHPGFFARTGPHSIAQLASAANAVATPPASGSTALLDCPIADVRGLAEAGPDHVTFVDNRKYLALLAGTRAAAVFVHPTFAARVPATATALVTKTPYRAFALSLQLFYPEARWSKVAGPGRDLIDPTAVLEDGVVVEAGAVVGPEARIGRGSRIAAGAVIGYRVAIGRDCYVGPGASVIHSLIGDRVILHGGVRLGQDGFGFAMGQQGHLKVPQIGRVIVQDDVEIGANTTVDRGALKDTIIGEGTKIDNLVQIGHNVIMGRHCVIVGQVGLSGSCELGDHVVMGGHSGVVGHVKVGSGVHIAGSSHVNDDVPPGRRIGGTPAVPFRDWARQLAAIKRLGEAHGHGAGDNRASDGDGTQT